MVSRSVGSDASVAVGSGVSMARGSGASVVSNAGASKASSSGASMARGSGVSVAGGSGASMASGSGAGTAKVGADMGKAENMAQSADTAQSLNTAQSADTAQSLNMAQFADTAQSLNTAQSVNTVQSGDAGKPKGKVRFSSLGAIGSTVGLFLLCPGMMTLGADGKISYFDFVLAFLFACAVLPLTAFASELIFRNKNIFEMRTSLEKTLYFLFALTAICATFYVCTDAIGNFAEFSQKTMLNGRGKTLISLLIIILCCYIAALDSLKHGNVIFKFAFVGLFAVFFLTALLFLCCFRDFHMENLEKILNPKGNISAKGSAYAFLQIFSFGVIPCVFAGSRCNANEKRHLKLSVFAGTLFAFVLLSLCFFTTALMLSENGLIFLYPYIAGISAGSYGKLFTRLEGFAYASYFVASVLKISLCTSLISSLLTSMLPKSISLKKRKILPTLVGAFLFASILISF